MHTIRKRIFCALTAVALLAAGSAGLLFLADGQYAARLAGEIRTRFQGGVLMDETFSPLPPSDSVLLFQRAASPIRPLSLNTSSSGDASVLIPYLPDYGSDLSLTVPKAGRWRLSYRTLDGLEVTADYTHAGQEALTVYLPEADLEVRLTGGDQAAMAYTAHARRPATPALLWTALTAELSYRL